MTVPVIEANNVCVDFEVPTGMFRKPGKLHAVNDVSLSVRRGDTLGLVGESGSGKSTLVGTLLQLVRPTSGSILVGGRPAAELSRREFARTVQPVFQDPYSSLNPYRSILDIVAQPLVIHGIGSEAERAAKVQAMLDLVGLPKRVIGVRPNELSGGQRQRVAIARALIIEPAILICDEPTSALDVSVQAQILNLMQDLQRDLGLTLIVVSHNLAVIEHLATEIAVMYCGKVVESGDAGAFFAAPRHPYSVSLLDSILMPDLDSAIPAGLPGQPPNALALPPGCSFASRCPRAMPVCKDKRPARIEVGDVAVECHLFAS